MNVAIVPSRLCSTRLKNKILLEETGHPLVWHTVQQIKKCKSVDIIVVACDSLLTVDAVRGECDFILTGNCNSGSDRVAEALTQMGGSIQRVVCWQCDEPEFDPHTVDNMVKQLDANGVDLVTACTPLTPEDETDPSAVKVLVDGSRAIDFSRTMMPRCKYRHLGLYAARPAYFRWFAKTPQTEREKTESLEQLRALEHGKRIELCSVSHAERGVDTEDTYRSFVARWRNSHEGLGQQS